MRITDQVLGRFLEIQQEIKDLELELKVIKESILESNGANTSHHIAIVKTQSRESVLSKSDIESKHGREFLEKYNLLKVSQFPVVVVTRKVA